MGKQIHGLPGNTFNCQKQKTIKGITYRVRAKSYWGENAGWYLYKNGKFVRYHNGHGLDNPLDPVCMLEWAINNL